MTDSVMSDLPLRRILKFVQKDWQSGKDIAKAYNALHPMSLDTWIRLSNAARRKVFNEEREDEVEKLLLTLEDLGYVECVSSRVHPGNPHLEYRKQTTFYRLTDKGISVRISARRGLP